MIQRQRIHIDFRFPIAITGLLALTLCVIAAGCGPKETNRQNLSGTVTYQGAPVPTGTIYFEPDSSQGNKGPQGFSSIVNGQYETKKFGKGAVTGPVLVSIAGFPAPKNQGDAVNEPLFPIYKTKIDISPETTEFNFDVPVK